MLFVIISFNIDLSIGSLNAFICAIAAYLFIQPKIPIILGIFLILIIGAFLWGIQGSIVSYLKVPSFIVTLGGMLMFWGLAMKVLNGQTKNGFPETYKAIGSGYIKDYFHINPSINLTLFWSESY